PDDRCPTPAVTEVHSFDRLLAEACSARWARYDLPWIFRMIAPSTIRSKNAIASGGSPRYSPHAGKSMFVTNAVDRPLRTLISLYSKLAAWGDSSRSTRSKPTSSRISRSNLAYQRNRRGRVWSASAAVRSCRTEALVSYRTR